MLFLAFLFAPTCIAAIQPYSLVENISPTGFFDHFNFYTSGDPTHGYVQYANRSYAESAGLIKTFSDHVTIGVDTQHIFDPNGVGRPSVRLESKRQYTHGLYIINLSHMPYGCGTWPAFWSFGPNWPNSGEIDIIEGVSTNMNNLMSLHTSAGCTIAGSNQAGTLVTSNCDVNSNSNTGCGTQAKSAYSYGKGFNDVGGGVYAMEWTSNHIKVWWFRSDRIPASIVSNQPDPSTFGLPTANFQGDCDIDAHFKNHNIILDITFCGDWAGNVYADSSCPKTQGASAMQSCINHVAGNPSAFTEAYWNINYLRIYQANTAAPSTPWVNPTSLSSIIPMAATASITSANIAQGANMSGAEMPSTALSVPTSILSRTTTTAREKVSSLTSSTTRQRTTDIKSTTTGTSRISSKSSASISSTRTLTNLDLPAATGDNSNTSTIRSTNRTKIVGSSSDSTRTAKTSTMRSQSSGDTSNPRTSDTSHKESTSTIPTPTKSSSSEATPTSDTSRSRTTLAGHSVLATLALGSSMASKTTHTRPSDSTRKTVAGLDQLPIVTSGERSTVLAANLQASTTWVTETVTSCPTPMTCTVHW